VLTAAHCVAFPDRTGILSKVRLGEWDKRTNPDCQEFLNEKMCNDPHVEIGIAKIITHPKFVSTNTIYHDIALLKLERDVEYTKWIKPICLPIEANIRNMNLTSRSLEVIGYGKTETRSSTNVKMVAYVDGFSTTECQSLYNWRNVFIQNMHVS
jgi:hypothetical protein